MQLCVQPPEAIENEELEIKGWCQDEKELAAIVTEAAMCLANAHGGVVLIGLEEERGRTRFSACPYRDVTPAWLVQRVCDLSIPPVTCQPVDLSPVVTDLRSRRNLNVFALEVPATKYYGSHHTSAGLSKIRVGKECQPQYTAADDRTAAFVPGIGIDDLKSSSIKVALRSHRKKFQVDRPMDELEFLTAMHLIERRFMYGEEEPHYNVTLAALLLFGTEASLRQHIGHFETLLDTGASVRPLRANIMDSLQALTIAENALLRTHCPKVDATSLHELLVNAYIHRCWRTSGPVMIHLSDTAIEIRNPGELLPGLHPDTLIHCVPAYRNLLLAESCRFIGVCDKIGRGIDHVYRAVLSGGYEFPIFESSNNGFNARISLRGSEEFAEFLRKRSQSFLNLDEIVVLRSLWSKEPGTLHNLAAMMQRGDNAARQVITEMRRRLLVDEREPDMFRLTDNVKNDIRNAFSKDQFRLFNES